VAPRDDKSVPGRHRVAVENPDSMLVLIDDARLGQRAERTVWLGYGGSPGYLLERGTIVQRLQMYLLGDVATQHV
jgi:hypothetical protein